MDSTDASVASCRCGQLRAVARGEPVRVSVCHCLACKQRTGSAFGYQARFPKARVTIEGVSKVFIRVADSGNRGIYHFCPECGSTVYYFAEKAPDTLAIPVGAFADPDFPAPRFSVYETRMHSWLQLSGDIERRE